MPKRGGGLEPQRRAKGTLEEPDISRCALRPGDRLRASPFLAPPARNRSAGLESLGWGGESAGSGAGMLGAQCDRQAPRVLLALYV